MTTSDDRLNRLEEAIVGLATVLNQQDAVPAVAAIAEDRDNTPDCAGHSPKMLRDWLEMQDKVMLGDGTLTREGADALLDEFFGKIERGELKPDGSAL